LTNNITTTSTRNNEASDNNIDDDNDDDEEDVDLPSNVLGCSDCIPQSVPFLRDAMNPKPRHTPAFVVSTTVPAAATIGDDNNDNNTTSLLELPAATQTRSNPSYKKNHVGAKRATTVRTNEITLKVSVRMARLDTTPIDTSSKYYDEVILGGWPCRVEPGCFSSSSTDNDGYDQCSSNSNTDNISSLRSRFESDILAASNALPKLARDKLMASTPIWINKSQCYGPKVAPITGRDGCFHPGSKWLKRNGMNPAKCGGVEWYDAQHYLSDCDLWGPGGLMLHELSHAWHCLHIENGYDNEEIIAVYKKAMEEKLYDCVRVHGSQGPTCKAYACQDQMEYFAELSVAFLGGVDDDCEHNKWYPFNRAQLREHDPRAFELLCKMWGVVVVEEEEEGEKEEEGGS
jgi:hypothetical protein